MAGTRVPLVTASAAYRWIVADTEDTHYVCAGRLD